MSDDKVDWWIRGFEKQGRERLVFECAVPKEWTLARFQTLWEMPADDAMCDSYPLAKKHAEAFDGFLQKENFKFDALDYFLEGDAVE